MHFKLIKKMHSSKQIVIIMCSAQRDFLIIASKASQPSDSDLPALLKDTAKCIEEIQTFR